MAQIINAGKTKGKRSNLNVDLTPLVDLGFLLITFFMFTASLQEATTMNLVMPKDSTDSTEISQLTSVNIMLLRDNRILYYEGKQTEVNYGTINSIRTIISKKRNELRDLRKDPQYLTVILMPGEHCSYNNFVDALDEITISNCTRYFISDPPRSLVAKEL